MTNCKFETGLGAFVRGMRLHDVAKPFFWGSEKHAAAGFMMLAQAKKCTEALYALFHHPGKLKIPDALSLLASWMNLKSDDKIELPMWVVLSSRIDQLAASSYTGADHDPKNTGRYSFENPFSRLPELPGLLKAKKSGSFEQMNISTTGNSDKLHDEVSKPLWNHEFGNIIPWDFINESVVGKISSDPSESVKAFCCKIADDASIFLKWEKKNKEIHKSDAHAIFRERTYPTANDVALSEHERLAAALALVVGGNAILSREYGIAHPELAVSFYTDTPPKDGHLVDLETIMDWKVFVENTNCLVVRIAFAHAERLMMDSVRLDDVHGAARNADQMKIKFKKAFHEQICKLIEGSLKPEDLEPLNDFPFDLVYLLPGKLGEQKVKKAVEDAFNEAIKLHAKDLGERYKDDFRSLFAKGLPKEIEANLENQLKSFCPDVAIQMIMAGDESRRCAEINLSEKEDEFQKFKKKYAGEMRQAYQSVWNDDPIRLSQDEALGVLKSAEQHAGGEICDVCGRHSAFSGFYQFYDDKNTDPKTKEFMEKVMYSHKEEPERICSLCMCHRTLSHGVVQEEWLKDMVWSDGNIVRQKRIKEGKMKPPPALLNSVILNDEDESIPTDMGACFVRVKNGIFQVYPTITAAADSDSNVALIQLEPDWVNCILDELKWDNTITEFGVSGGSEFRKELFHKLSACLKTACKESEAGLRSTIDNAKNHIMLHGEGPNKVIIEELDVVLKELDQSKNYGKIIEKLTEMADWVSCLKDSDLGRFRDGYAAQCLHIDKESSKFFNAATHAFPHLARVLTRIEWINNFFSTLPQKFVEGHVRTLTLEAEYPRLVLLVPADSLAQTLCILHKHAARALFSSMLHDVPQQILKYWQKHWVNTCLKILGVVLPRVLCGAVVVFKARQPLYHVLSSARQVVKSLEKSERRGGIHLGFTDLRGGMGALHESTFSPIVQTDFSGLYRVFDAVEPPLSRRHVYALNRIQQSAPASDSEFISANIHLMKKRYGWTDNVPETLIDKKLFQAVSFIKTVTKDNDAYA
jgi:hypothetical protein